MNLAEPPCRLASQGVAAREPVLALRPCRLSADEGQRAGLPSNSSTLPWRLSIQSRAASLPLAQLPLTSERALRFRFTRSSAGALRASQFACRCDVKREGVLQYPLHDAIGRIRKQ